MRQVVADAAGALDSANYEFFPQYELKVDGSTTIATKYYFFGEQRIAQKVGTGALTYLHADHLGSVVETTGVVGDKRFYPFGATRATSGSYQTDYGYTGQHNDATGLLYYKARYYDPASGQFISPDTIVPDPDNIFDYNRYMYGYGNPVKYSDPSGHAAACSDRACWEAQFNAQNAWYNARGFFWGGEHWSQQGAPVIATRADAEGVLTDAGISLSWESGLSWKDAWVIAMADGMSLLGSKLDGTSASAGLQKLSRLLGGSATMMLQTMVFCNDGAPCSWGGDFRTTFWPESWLSARNGRLIGATAVHEVAHLMDWQSQRVFRAGGPTPLAKEFLDSGGAAVTSYGNTGFLRGNEMFAEGVTSWTYGTSYAGKNGFAETGPLGNDPLVVNQAAIISSIFSSR